MEELGDEFSFVFVVLVFLDLFNPCLRNLML